MLTFLMVRLILIVVFAGLFCQSPALANDSNAIALLTSDALQKRLNIIQQNEKNVAIDLTHFRIDLSDNNADFRDEFYRQLRRYINQNKMPLAIDFSQSIFIGELDLQKLTLQIPLVEESLKAVLTDFELQELHDRFPDFQNQQNPTNLKLFRSSLKLEETNFTDRLKGDRITFLRSIDADGVIFEQASNWSNSTFLSPIYCQNSQFLEAVDFSNAYFNKSVDFAQAEFFKVADWTRSQWQEKAVFRGAIFRDRAIFRSDRFLQTLDFQNVTFEQTAIFRSSRFNQPLNFQEVSFLDRLDFSNAVFTSNVIVRVDGLGFDAESATILGDRDAIGKVLRVSSFTKNETILRNLARNFRQLEQIQDANAIDYQTKQLRLKRAIELIRGTPLNLNFLLRRNGDIFIFLSLNLLLALSDYGTNYQLILLNGLLAISLFSFLLWSIDRYPCRQTSFAQLSTQEIRWAIGSCSFLLFWAIVGILQTASHPYLTFFCLAIILIPFPCFLILRLYQMGKDRLNISYFVENGSERQLRISIGNLPIIPKYPFFRDRYSPILRDRGWSWLNYYGFTLNTFLKLSFNDIRLRDEYLPGIVSTLVWYQWTLGLLYIVLLFWTLSRTIPGLNLLLYLS